MKSLDDLPPRISALLVGAGLDNEEKLKIHIGQKPSKLLEIEGFGQMALERVLGWLDDEFINRCHKSEIQRKTLKKEARQRHERVFAYQLRAFKVEGVQEQFRFHPERKWTFDFAHPETKIAVEVDGGLHIRGGGGHNSRKGYEKDREKDQAALLAGWRVLRVTPTMIRKGGAIQSFLKLLNDNS